MAHLGFCTKCGTPRGDAPRFCRNCGADLGTPDAAPGAAAPRTRVPSAVPAPPPTIAQKMSIACPQCGSAVGETTGSPMSPAINVYRCPSCRWTALRCGNVACDGYLKPAEIGYPTTVRYTCVKCGWTGTGTRFSAAPVSRSTPTVEAKSRGTSMRRGTRTSPALSTILAGLIVVILGVALGWAGVALLRDAIAHDGSLIIPAALLALPLCWVGVGLVRFLEAAAPPLRRHDRTKTFLIFGVAAVLGVGLYNGVRLYDLGNRPDGPPDPGLTAALAPACAGRAVEGAGTVDTSGATVNHLVVLDTSGRRNDWTGQTPLGWQPATLADVELVACSSPTETAAVLEVCQYEGGSDISRYSATRTVSVFEAGTGRRLATFSSTDIPRECDQTERADLTELRGSVSWATVQSHLTGIVEHGVFQDPDASGGPPSPTIGTLAPASTPGTE